MIFSSFKFKKQCQNLFNLRNSGKKEFKHRLMILVFFFVYIRRVLLHTAYVLPFVIILFVHKDTSIFHSVLILLPNPSL